MEKKVIDLSKETGEIEILLPAIENTETVYSEKRIQGTPWTTKQPDKLVIFTKKDPFNLVPKSWEEFCKKNPYAEIEFFINTASNIGDKRFEPRCISYDRNLCATQEDAEAFLALIQLRRLWHEWTKVLGTAETHHKATSIVRDGYSQVLEAKEGIISGALVFKEKAHTEKFIECFGGLLEKAKILL